MRRTVSTLILGLLLFPVAMATEALDHRAVQDKVRALQGYLPKGESFFEKACDDGDGYACLLFARQSGVIAAFPARKFRGLLEECQSRNSVSCLGTARAYEWGIGARRSTEDARHFLAIACALREGEACFALARMRSKEESGDLLQQACTWGSPEACVQVLSRKGEASRKQLEKLCADGRAHACHLLGVNSDGEAKGRWLAKACDQGDADGCLDLGKAASSEERALALYKKGCDGGSPEACLSRRKLLEAMKTFWPNLARHLTLVCLAVGGFAAWMARRRGIFEALTADGQESGRALELRALRRASVAGFLLQFGMLAWADLALPSQRGWNGVLFALAVMAQAQLQFRNERRVRALGATHRQQLGLMVRAAAAVGLLLGGYGSLVALVGVAFSRAVAWTMHVPHPPAWTEAVGGLLGAFLGLAFVYLIAPVQVRLLFPVTRIREGALLEKLHLSFARAGLAPPEFWMIEMDHFRMANALVAGAPWGRGWLRPGLFITRSVAQNLTPEEFEAVVCHEMSHLLLGHLRKRVRRIAAVFVGGYVLNIVALAVLLQFLPPSAHVLVVIAAVAGTFFFQFTAIRRNVRAQEIEADLHAVGHLGAGVEAMAGALRKLDQLNDQIGASKDPTSYLNPSAAHPTTDERIRLLEEKFAAPPAPLEKSGESRAA